MMQDRNADRDPTTRSREAGRRHPFSGSLPLRLAGVAAIALLAANCSSQNRVASGNGVDPKYGVKPSPSVVADGEPVPKGGGRSLVGTPYQVAGRTYVPREERNYSREGWASWYGSDFHGRLTANGEVFDRYSISAAHPTLPLPSYVRVTNVKNSRSMIVRVNDRGPYHGNRLMDVSQNVAEALDFRRVGTARVRVDYMGPASLRGSDDRKLLATLRTDGGLASLPGQSPVMVASTDPFAVNGPAAPAAAARSTGPSLTTLAMMNAPARSETVPTPATSRRSEEPVPTARAEDVARRVAANVPLPPERPFDLGRVRAADAGPAARPARRTAEASLFYADAGHDFGFESTSPFADLRPQTYVSLRRER